MDQEKKVGFMIHFYTDVPVTGTHNAAAQPIPHLHIQKKDLPTPLPNVPLKAEAVICRACKQLGIGATGFYLFGLQLLKDEPSKDPGPYLWIPPNKLLERAEERLQHFRLRIRFIPTPSRLALESDETINYFFLQCRHDFVNDHVTISEKYKLQHKLGLGVIDKLRWAKEFNVDPLLVKKTKPWLFLPASSSQKFKNFFDKQRLTSNFNSKLEDLGDQNHTGRLLRDLKLRYINGLLTYSEQYGVEEFNTENTTVTEDPKHANYDGPSNKTVIVDPNDETHHGIFTRHKHSGEERSVCQIADVMSLSLNQSPLMDADRSWVSNPWIVTISRKHEGHPQTLEFVTKEKALSFMSLIDGYHRLIEDFHEQVSSDVFSPTIQELARYKSFGPVSLKWAEKRLLEKHNQEQNINYIMLQDQESMEKYVVFFIPPQSQRNKADKMQILKDESGEWTCQYNDAPKFKYLRQLLEYYRSGKDQYFNLKRYVAPSGRCDKMLYLCRTENDNAEEKEASVKAQLHTKVSLVSRINQQTFKFVSRGTYTEVLQFMYEKEEHTLQRMAVKRLQAGLSQYLEAFTKSMNNLSFWKCPTILSVHTICLYPFQVVMDYAEFGDLHSLMEKRKNKKDPLTIQHLITASEQIAQALLYLQEYSHHAEGDFICHGNIRCKNVFVFELKEKAMSVKLGDSGMVDVYRALPMRHKINEERIPWVAPELIDLKLRQEHSIQRADVYSFGVFLWELFSEGERPFKEFDLRHIINCVLHKEGLEPPETAPLKVQHLIRRCLNVHGTERPDAKEVVRTIRQSQTDVYHSTPMNHQYEIPKSSEVDPDAEVYDAQTAAIPLSQQEQEARLDQLLGQESMDLMHQSTDASSPVMRNFSSSGTGTIPDSVPQSPTNHMSGPWDSTAPLLPSRNVQTYPALSSRDDISLDTSRTSLDTTTTELYGPSSPPPHQVPRPLLNRPLPALPVLSALSTEAGSIELEPDRVQYNVRGEPVGKGHYGEVYIGYYVQFDGTKRKVAIKTLKSNQVEKQKEFAAEIDMMTTLHHPHVVEIIGQTKPNDRQLLLVMEFVEKGCLRDHLSKVRKTPGLDKRTLHDWKPTLLRYSLEMCEAMVYLSNNKIVHRDLAARNVLVTGDNHLKISDFGLARHLQEKDYYAMSDRKKDIPVFWCAPESLRHRRFTSKTDVWGLGVTLWETFSFGKPPTYGVKVNYLLHYLDNENKRLGRDVLYGCPDAMYSDVMMKCWEYLPENRLHFEQILDRVRRIEAECQ